MFRNVYDRSRDNMVKEEQIFLLSLVYKNSWIQVMGMCSINEQDLIILCQLTLNFGYIYKEIAKKKHLLFSYDFALKEMSRFFKYVKNRLTLNVAIIGKDKKKRGNLIQFKVKKM